MNRNKIDAAVEGIEGVLRDGDQHKITEVLRKTSRRSLLMERQEEYLKFVNGYRPRQKPLKVPWWSRIYKVDNGILLGFAGLATSLIAFGEDERDYGKLVLGDYQLNAIFGKLRKVNVRICLIHHPVSYLIEEERRSVLRYLIKNCSLVLRGHLHEQDSLVYKTDSDQMIELATGPAYHDKRYDNSFQIIEIDTDKQTVLIQYWLWKNNSWIIDRNAFQTTNGQSEFELIIFNKSNLGKKPRATSTKELKTEQRRKVSHEFVKLPISWQAERKLNKLLRLIQQKAYRELKKKYNNLQSNSIRANVFLPGYRNAKEFKDILLYIPEFLRVNMNYKPELDIKFPPKKGATGVTFVDGKARYTKRISKEAGEWESKLKMTEKLKKIVHKDLKWILSIPLIDPSEKNVILGVMNIDGLDYVINENVLKAAILKLYMDLHAFMLYLSGRPREIVKF